jgi:hypothetical protein
MSYYRVLVEAVDPLDGETIYLSDYVKPSVLKKYESLIRRYYPEHKWLEKNKVEITEENPFQPHDERCTVVNRYGLSKLPATDARFSY